MPHRTGPPPAAPPPDVVGDAVAAADAARAPWGRRCAAFLVDLAATWLLVAAAYLFARAAAALEAPPDYPPVVLLLCLVPALVLGLHQRVVVSGITGFTLGRWLLGIRLVGEESGRPVGVGRALLRELAHLADAPLGVGFLRPLWHARRQTFADTAAGTAVVPRAAAGRGRG